ncbi:NAD(P)H-dependent glycerol-3-phosphate dehydrogenase [Pelagibacterium luteolum]|uniref:Glycerol-3-phosphate dehydrogenase [NAD(P)+] n=1 Tax=Pelagibacterium luteolum TaxID=440168 RepID=A0A1G7SCD8_9HYPH|nr:NAD(P)H-dependent glycerol-3-phosphate dehydrogenase [Pelagibacterium luteolum]SDG20735.1 glycerol-3-phosphate dehydrogenase (NAD(P)+) [Pelagibacterium luteolum]
MARVFVIGAGAWGTALAQAARFAGHDVTLSGRDAQAAREINESHRLSAYLGDIALDPDLRAQTGFDAIAAADAVLMVVPAQATRATLEAIGPDALSGKPVILCAKGLETGSNDRQSEILAELAPEAEPFVLSGPSFAHDVAAGKPTAVTLAGHSIERADEMAGLLASDSFRPYASEDIVGVEMCGALKNVYALGAGAIEGAGLGLSARSAFLARAYAELGRVIVALGGIDATLSGLAGIGDLALSCTSEQSRNYRFGIALGRGQSVDAIRSGGMGLAEGVFTAPVAKAVADRHAIDAPLIGAVDLLLSGEARIEAIVPMLMRRPLKREG